MRPCDVRRGSKPDTNEFESLVSQASTRIDEKMLNGSGNNQSAARDTDINVSIVGSSSGQIASETLTAASTTAASTTAASTTDDWLSALAYNFSEPVMLNDSETYELIIATTNFPNSEGNNTGLGTIVVNGAVAAILVPEPASFAIWGIIGCLRLQPNAT